MSGRNPPSYCTLTLIAMQGHQQKGRQNSTSSNNKDKSNTIIETSTAEDHDDENLHNPETVQDAGIHLEVDEEQWAVVVFTLKKRSDLYSVPSMIRTGPTDANAFHGHRLATQKGAYYEKSKRNKRTQM